jgi:phosphoglycerate dehydrogenase-like enzyme
MQTKIYVLILYVAYLASRVGVMVMNTPGGNTVSTAQLAVSLMCSLARKIPAADISIKSVSMRT